DLPQSPILIGSHRVRGKRLHLTTTAGSSMGAANQSQDVERLGASSSTPRRSSSLLGSLLCEPSRNRSHISGRCRVDMTLSVKRCCLTRACTTGACAFKEANGSTRQCSP